MRDRDELRKRVESMNNLATMPKSILTVGAMIDGGAASSSTIAREVAKDQVLSAKLLKLVNSGFCGFRSPIASISQATLLLGLDALRMLIYSTTVLDLAEAVNHRMKGFWEHAVGTARTSALLAERAGLSRPEELAVAGLMHDIGKVVIAQVVPDECDHIRRLVAERDCLQIDAEREILGVTHLDVGAWFVTTWSLPARLRYPVAYHNAYDDEQEHADRTAVVHVADIICRAKGIGFAGDRRVPAINRGAWSVLKLSMDDVADTCAALDVLVASGALA